MNCLEFIYYISATILNILIISGLVWFVVNLSKARNYEKKIKGLYKELEVNIDEEKKRRTSMEIINLRIKY